MQLHSDPSSSSAVFRASLWLGELLQPHSRPPSIAEPKSGAVMYFQVHTLLSGHPKL